MQCSSERMTRAMKPLMTLCCVALLAACTPPSGGAQATTLATATGQTSVDSEAGNTPATVADSSSACADAASPVQTLICKDPALARLEADLTKAAAAAHATLDAAGQTQLRAEQQRWQQHTRDLCADAQCLQQVYADRIRIVSATRTALTDQAACIAVDGQKECVDVMILRDPNSQLQNFNTLMGENDQKGTLLGCTAATNLAAGTAGGNDMYAANCTLESTTGRSNVQVCSNQMVGDFVVEPAPVAYGEQAARQLVGFTQQNCAG